MIGYWLLVLHALGDYVTQSDWMARNKTKRWWPAIAHAVVYTVPFALLLPRWEPLMLIGVSHLLLDRFRLVRYVCWAKNLLAPGHYHQCDKCGHVVKAEQEVRCWKCGKTLGGEMIFTRWRHPWSECSGTGYHRNDPAWLTVWLMIIVDNTIHLAINGLAWCLWGVA